MLQTNDFSSDDTCPQDGLAAGTYLVTRDGTATKISDSTSGFPIWVTEVGAFFYPKGDVFAAVRPDSSPWATPAEFPDSSSWTTPAELISPVVAPDGKAYVWQNAKGGIDLFLNGGIQTVTNLQPAAPVSPLDLTGYSQSALPSVVWNQDSTGFVFTSGQKLYVAQAENKFVPVEVTDMDKEMDTSDQFLFKVNP